MLKAVLLGLSIACIGCKGAGNNGALVIDQHDETTPIEFRVLQIKDSDKFLTDLKGLRFHFHRACTKSIKRKYTIEEDDWGPYGHVMYVLNESGYIILYMPSNPLECYISFFCVDTRFDYDKFASYMTKVCCLFEAPHIPDIREG